MIVGTRREINAKLREAQGLSRVEQRNLRDELNLDVFEWEAWLQEMEDQDTVKTANKMGIHLDDIPSAKSEDDRDEDDRYRHYEIASWNNRVLRPESRRALLAKMRERAPLYRKERREIVEVYIKAAAAVVGVIGAMTGFVAVLMKK